MAMQQGGKGTADSAVENSNEIEWILLGSSAVVLIAGLVVVFKFKR